MAVVVVLAGCGLGDPSELSFRIDDRLHFTSPESRSTVRAPLTVTWTMDDFRIAAEGSEPASDDAGYFAVFVDQAPVKPGHPLGDVADGDPLCENAPGCPDEEYLRNHDVYTTTSDRIEIETIPNLLGSKETEQLHAITVVLIDTAGHRIGESAWLLEIRMRKVGF